MTTVTAQTKREKMRERREQFRGRVDSVLLARYNKVNYDTNFITRPQTRLTLKVRNNLSIYNIHGQGTMDGIYSKAKLHTATRATLSFSASYRGISAALAINPASLSGRNKDYELNVNVYTNRYSIDASYQHSKTLSGDIEQVTSYHVNQGNVSQKVLTLTGYYTFNYRRFSFPAAFTQSYIQRRSAGSWLAGFSFQGGEVETSDDAPAYIPQARIYVGHFGIGGGYAYNLVVRDKWLFHISLLPTVVVFNRSNITIDGEKKKIHTKFPDMIFNERIAIVRNFSTRYFAGLTAVISNTLFNDNNVVINQNKYYTRLFVGMRL